VNGSFWTALHSIPPARSQVAHFLRGFVSAASGLHFSIRAKSIIQDVVQLHCHAQWHLPR